MSCARSSIRGAISTAGSRRFISPTVNSSRTFFSLSDISKLAQLTSNNQTPGSDPDEQKFHARKILPYSQSQLYALVSDVPSYSSFIPFCSSSTVLVDTKQRQVLANWKPDDKPFDIDAELKVGFGGLEERYISRVAGRPFESVTATASEATPLFNSLKTTWSFAPASTSSPHPSFTSTPPSQSREPNATEPSDPTQGPTLLTIDLAFSFANPLHRIASQAVLPKVADKMVEAFEKRCLKVYGRQ